VLQFQNALAAALLAAPLIISTANAKVEKGNIAPPAVIVSIKPLHALVSGVMKGIGEPTLLVKGAASPHLYALKPSDARHIAQANLIFRIGPTLEVFLEKPLKALGTQARIVDVITARHVLKLAYRGHHEPATVKPDQHTHEDGKAGVDPHIWLDPDNAIAISQLITRELIAADAENASSYGSNASRMISEIRSLDLELKAELAAITGMQYLVHHDGYQYFEAHFGLTRPSVISQTAHQSPGARRVRTMRQRITSTNARCVFTEPQFPPRLAIALTSGSDARLVELDPIGANLDPGPNAYLEMMRNMARAFTKCLSLS
jgi:zinc transport system substrate-binding protein